MRDRTLLGWLKQGLVVILKNAQSMAFGCHLEEAVIFQRKLQKKIARSNGKDKSGEEE
jgi:hypothetical protein